MCLPSTVTFRCRIIVPSGVEHSQLWFPLSTGVKPVSWRNTVWFSRISLNLESHWCSKSFPYWYSRRHSAGLFLSVLILHTMIVMILSVELVHSSVMSGSLPMVFTRLTAINHNHKSTWISPSLIYCCILASCESCEYKVLQLANMLHIENKYVRYLHCLWCQNTQLAAEAVKSTVSISPCWSRIICCCCCWWTRSCNGVTQTLLFSGY